MNYEPGIIPEYDFLTVEGAYGDKEPNLHHGPYLDIYRGEIVIRGKRLLIEPLLNQEIVQGSFPGLKRVEAETNEVLEIHGPLNESETILSLDGNAEEKITKIRRLRQILFDSNFSENQGPKLSAYWLVNMPFAKSDGQGFIKPTHHVMSLPNEAVGNSCFSFFDYSPAQLTQMRCNSYDLMLCTNNQVVEVAGGDQRIDTARLQKQALSYLRLPQFKYTRLLQILELNEQSGYKHKLAGFAFGVERFAMLIAGLEKIDQVQVYPTNDPSGRLIHTI